jgi:uncharacterized heparinase superfamily protein
MYSMEPHIKVQLQFRAMAGPVEVSVPWSALRFLDLHTERMILMDGSVVYRMPNTRTAHDSRIPMTV